MSLDILNKKYTLPILILALLGTTGLGVHGTISDVQKDNTLFEHISNEFGN